jgi:hypothetical protein
VELARCLPSRRPPAPDVGRGRLPPRRSSRLSQPQRSSGDRQQSTALARRAAG